MPYLRHFERLALIHAAPTKATEHLVLLTINDHIGSDDTCFPGHKTIAKETRLSVRSVVNILNRMESQGILFIERRFKKGQQTSNLYRFNWEHLADLKTRGERCAPFSTHGGGEESAPLGVNDVHGGGEESAPLGVNDVHTESINELINEVDHSNRTIRKKGIPNPEKGIHPDTPLKADPDQNHNSERPAPSFRPSMQRDTGDPFFGSITAPWIVRGAADNKLTPDAGFLEYLLTDCKMNPAHARNFVTSFMFPSRDVETRAGKQAKVMIYWEEYQKTKPSAPTQGSRPHQIEQADGSRIVQSSTPGKAYRITRDEDGNEKAEMINIPEEHQ